MIPAIGIANAAVPFDRHLERVRVARFERDFLALWETQRGVRREIDFESPRRRAAASDGAVKTQPGELTLDQNWFFPGQHDAAIRAVCGDDFLDEVDQQLVLGVANGNDNTLVV